VVIGMGFNIIDKITGHIGLIYDLNPPLIAVVPSFIALSLALLAIRKVQ